MSPSNAWGITVKSVQLTAGILPNTRRKMLSKLNTDRPLKNHAINQHRETLNRSSVDGAAGNHTHVTHVLRNTPPAISARKKAISRKLVN